MSCEIPRQVWEEAETEARDAYEAEDTAVVQLEAAQAATEAAQADLQQAQAVQALATQNAATKKTEADEATAQVATKYSAYLDCLRTGG